FNYKDVAKNLIQRHDSIESQQKQNKVQFKNSVNELQNSVNVLTNLVSKPQTSERKPLTNFDRSQIIKIVDTMCEKPHEYFEANTGKPRITPSYNQLMQAYSEFRTETEEAVWQALQEHKYYRNVHKFFQQL